MCKLGWGLSPPLDIVYDSNNYASQKLNFRKKKSQFFFVILEYKKYTIIWPPSH